MTSHIDRMRTRRVRAILQIGAATAVVAAVGLAFVDDDLARAGAVALLGGVLLVVLKATMMAGQAAATSRHGLDRVTAASPVEVRSLQAAHDALRSEHDALLADHYASQTEVAELRARIETLASLARRVEPSVADNASLRHEMTYLRETVERLDRAAGSG
ncbi:MAG: hypothetical protein DHS20C19_08950 [Acidimicrobiales bacterium]|nr:MAG: hypothetical protein DHS20C19_08950 [Acidimicrobiales bacterium]